MEYKYGAVQQLIRLYGRFFNVPDDNEVNYQVISLLAFSFQP